MKPDDLVIATQDIDGIVKNSVGIIKSIYQKDVFVHFVGKDREVAAPSDSLSIINLDLDRKIITVESTGKEYSNRICNKCYVLKNMDDKMSARCKDCRKSKSMWASEKRRMEEKRPPDRSVFECPICGKRMIPGIRKRIIVADHDHKTRKGREWICHSCNSALGRFGEDITVLEKAIDYLKRFKSQGQGE